MTSYVPPALPTPPALTAAGLPTPDSLPTPASRPSAPVLRVPDSPTPRTRPAPSRRAGRRRVAAAVAVGGGLALLGALPAAAHVRVTADSTEPGRYSALTFRVPNEDDRASTTELSVELPQDTPFASVQTRAVPGWRAELVTAPLPSPVEVNGTTLTRAVRTVTWTAERGAAIAPGQYQEFALSVGPLPAGGELLLPASQTYSDGEVVRWDEPTPANGAEPEHPAPTLQVAAGTTDAGAPADPPVAAASAGGSTATWLGGGGLALAAVATGLAALALRAARTRRPA